VPAFRYTGRATIGSNPRRSCASRTSFYDEIDFMVTTDQLRDMITARPFRPFLVRMNGGRSFVVKHPENAACDPRGRAMTIYDDQGSHLVEMLLVDVMEPVTSPTDPGTQGNGT
jgi:hypothetical protein